jgi:hypothetical protein
MNVCFFVRMISAMLRRSGGDAGAVMFEAYRHIVSIPISSSFYMLDLLESVNMTMYTVNHHSLPWMGSEGQWNENVR